MKSMQRRLGGMMKRSDDEQDVGTILKEFNAADQMLEFLIKELKIWRDGWDDILKLQYNASEAFATLYKPIEPIQDPEMTRTPAETPQQYLQKCLGMQKVYSDTREDLQQEIGLIDDRLVKKAEEARLHSRPLKKAIKHRENMKLDYERYLSRVDHAQKREARSAKDETTLAKHEADLAQARIMYQSADDHVKETFPPVTDAIHALLPYLLATMIKLQTTLVGQIYTVLDEYTRKYGLPNPAPNNSQIVDSWDQEFTSFRKELESGIQMVATGKAVHLAMTLPEASTTVSGLGIRNKIMNRQQQGKQVPTPQRASVSPRQSITQGEDEPAPPKPPRPHAVSSTSTSSLPSSKPRVGSQNLGVPSHPPPPYDTKPTDLTPERSNQTSSWVNQQASGGATPPSRYATPTNGASPMLTPSANAGGDYFANRRTSTASSIASAAAAAVASKKKPPPPVPAKRLPSTTTHFVTALYDFDAQNAGDLAFREGDRIRVIKKTDSTDDWWQGELRGATGSFPANYVQL